MQAHNIYLITTQLTMKQLEDGGGGSIKLYIHNLNRACFKDLWGAKKKQSKKPKQIWHKVYKTNGLIYTFIDYVKGMKLVSPV